MLTAPFAVREPIRPAASLLVLRDSPAGPEVLMLQRVERSDDRMSGAVVFPGGAVDAGDRQLHVFAQGLDDVVASRRLELPVGGLDYFVAAIRECFEEAGLLFAQDADGADEILPAPLGRNDLRELCEARGLRLSVDRLAYFGHWLSPAGLAKRFDTRFFVAVAPPGQVAQHDGCETIAHMWVRPAEALRDGSDLKLMQITRHMLRWVARFESAAACLAHAAALPKVSLQVPRIATGPAGQRTILPDEPAYAEIGRLDPDGMRHDVRHQIEPGVPVRLSPRVVRVTAPNPGMMTGPGTNSYLVGGGPDNEWVVIDPGPDDATHLAALLAAVPGTVTAILVTHTHMDHSPGAAALQAATGAPVWGLPAAHPNRQDTRFRPDHLPRHGGRIAAGDVSLRVIHTPGHASNHLCFLLEVERTLFTGDHVMQGSTVVIDPPDGDMGAYLASLEALLAEDLQWLAPGHGFLIGDPQAALRRLIAHRLAREAKLRTALLGRPDGSTLDDLVTLVYNDVPERLHTVARRSLRAHLLKLAADGEIQSKAAEDDAAHDNAADENEATWSSIRRDPITRNSTC